VISFWNSFIGSSSDLNLIWSIKYDHSPKVRLVSSNALTVYLECVKAFFTIAAAEDSSSATAAQQPATAVNPSASFLPISYTIATLIRQLHRDLISSLCYREKFTLNQIQLLKCLKCLIKATPYAKLKPGLVYKLIMSLNLILCQKSNAKYAKDTNNASLLSEVLNCLELALVNNSQMIEVHLAILAPNLGKAAEDDTDLSGKIEQLRLHVKLPNLTHSRVTYFYEANGGTGLFSGCGSSKRSSLNASATASGRMTPLLNELLNEENDETTAADQSNGKSWLVGFCLRNASMLEGKQQPQQTIHANCLDLLVVVCRKYFDIIRKDMFFDDMCKLILDKLVFFFSFSCFCSVHI
jgi:hypothetical protein